jgi:hypothetical protein
MTRKYSWWRAHALVGHLTDLSNSLCEIREFHAARGRQAQSRGAEQGMWPGAW